ncbi:LEAF RUST 10 DISEASE-RESISTANCE LOCUS RECEPTOR-LIKE PROTEIN KINASE-like 1.2 isoform X6 [Oryza brachyantha]|uniref:LEAF RUST 10 DISEASE-RESISTANCE LOCUS RECEPTOR-LIKE PROTEIN KINASE-like 1.2 isoform X6 n=1 Tax=Oryza brachyantha TaxID=4533 RepID=UPI00077689DF|nr:LEAF RUST 10 DISEASE-RESISTANCE LOCUS RECEPTOR-LIKE PROTEIN KINASE-like 1.2 isoform X6 [Oryza brachyantha]
MAPSFLVSAWWLALMLAAAARGAEEDGAGCPPSKKCGNLTISSPFWIAQSQMARPCGALDYQVDCNDSAGIATLRSSSYVGFQIIDISYGDRTLLAFDFHKLLGLTNSSSCQVPRWNTSAKMALKFRISPDNLNLVFYNCTKSPAPAKQQELALVETLCRNETFARLGRRYDGRSDYEEYSLEGCSTVFLPVREMPGGKTNASSYKELISRGFFMTWDPPTGSKGNRRTIGIALGAGGGILAIIIFSFVWHKHKKRKQSRDLKDLMRSTSSMQSYSKDLELGGSPHIFTYEELEKATDGFSASRELGDGGFGTVYKGKLQDGRVVAVKRLYKNNYRRVEQFVNEVDILSRLLHQNLVTLYGCTSRSSHDLLLVYEFIPNGTVADHLHGPRAAERGLTWPARMTIAIETAEALAYLHAVEIIHRDVKTNNILLDNSFHVKVADFGLSRLFPLEVTHVSTVPQGTPGYVDPVYHQCYKLTDKSDVYSFGVVLVELISSKPAVDMSRSHSDINLASMALNRIQNHEVDQLVDPELGYETDSETKRMIDLVAELAFQCLQLDRDNRPPIKEVVAVLHCIKNGECPAKMMNKDASPKEDSHLLKDNLQYSPDSVIHRFHSQSTNHSVASNSSG